MNSYIIFQKYFTGFYNQLVNLLIYSLFIIMFMKNTILLILGTLLIAGVFNQSQTLNCLNNQIWNGIQCIPSRPVATKATPLIRSAPQNNCPPNQIWTGKFCQELFNAIPSPTLLTTTASTTTQRTAITNFIQSPTVLTQPNIVCPSSFRWNGRTCEKVCQDDRSWNQGAQKCVCNQGLIESNGQCVPEEGSLNNCKLNEIWNGEECVPVDKNEAQQIKRLIDEAKKCNDKKLKNCSYQQSHPKFDGDSLRKFFQTYKPPTNEPTLQQLGKIVQDLKKKFGKKSIEEQIPNNQFSSVNSRLSPTLSYKDLSKIDMNKLFQDLPSDTPKLNTRLLESQSNQHPQYDEGNFQAYSGSCIWRIKTTGFVRSIHSFKVDTPTPSKADGFSFWNFNPVEIHVYKNYLASLGYQRFNPSRFVVFIQQFNPKTCFRNLGVQPLILSRNGRLVGSRQRNGRLIIVTQVGWQTHDSIITNGPSIVQTDNMCSNSNGVFVKHIWNIPINNIVPSSSSWFFQNFYFAQYTYLMNIQKQDNLYLTEILNWGSYFKIHTIENVISVPNFASNWRYNCGEDSKGFVMGNLAVDQYASQLRVVAVSWPKTLFYSFNAPDVSQHPPFIESVYSNYQQEFLQSCIFVQDFAYLVYNSAIIAFDTNNPSTSITYPQNNNIQSLLKFKANSFLIGFGYRKNSATSIPIVKLFKISGSSMIQQGIDAELSKSGAFDLNYFWSHQYVNINQPTNSVIFGFYNYHIATPQRYKRGMYYLFAHTNGCLSHAPSPIIPSSCYNSFSSWFAMIHPYPYTNPNNSPYQVSARYSIMTMGGVSYLYGTSEKYFQAYKIRPPTSPNLVPPIFISSTSFQHSIPY